MTLARTFGSRFLAAITPVILVSCGNAGASGPPPAPPAARVAPPPAAAPEAALGVADRGIWSDLDPKVQLHLPADLAPDRVSATIDRTHRLLVLALDGFPRMA